ncbi:MAG TPA: DUF4147 domain-containing protein [Terriglobales bacterium]|nr:DUF4147 domain-containing protein [Terriglobales bacterium]
MRAFARQIFLDTLQEISISRVFQKKVEYLRGVLRVEDDLYNLDEYERVSVIAMGKAANAMLEALIAQTGPRFEGVVVCLQEPTSQIARFRYFLGGHPFPNSESVAAARTILKHVAGATEHTLVIYLISGGASAMVEAPFFEEITLDDLVATYRVLVHSGATITEINAIRKHFSAIKGGRLARAAYPAQQVSIMVSDVPERCLDALASGPTMPDSSTVDDCYCIADTHGLIPQMPASVRAIFEEHALEETTKGDDPAFVNSRWWPVLSSATAAQAAAALLKKHGFHVEIDNTPDDWPSEKAADYLLARIRELRGRGPKVALVSAGEIILKLHRESGIGGRNQHFALQCAEKIAGENLTVLSAGTDGIDGNSIAAGAVVDGTTWRRAKEIGQDARQALANFNAFPVLERLGDAIVTGPTENNVRDIRLLLVNE